MEICSIYNFFFFFVFIMCYLDQWSVNSMRRYPYAISVTDEHHTAQFEFWITREYRIIPILGWLLVHWITSFSKIDVPLIEFIFLVYTFWSNFTITLKILHIFRESFFRIMNDDNKLHLFKKPTILIITVQLSFVYYNIEQ